MNFFFLNLKSTFYFFCLCRNFFIYLPALYLHLTYYDLDVSSIGVAPSGTELVLGHTNGTISVLHMENYKWKAKYHLDLQVRWLIDTTAIHDSSDITYIIFFLQYNCPITAASYCFDNSKLAVATENGNLNIFRRSKY